MVNTISWNPNSLSVSIAIFTIVIFALIESLPLFAHTQADNRETNASSKIIGNIEMKKESKSVTYYDNVSGYLAIPQSNISTSDKALPAAVMIHEWWGLNDNKRNGRSNGK